MQDQVLTVSRPTVVRKSNYYGWVADTYFKIQSEGENKNRFVKVTTSKGSSGLLSTVAQVMDVGDKTESFGVFTDPTKWLNRGEKTRSTEKTVLEQHTRALNDLQAADANWVHVRG